MELHEPCVTRHRAVDINRNVVFFFGMVLVLFGIQLGVTYEVVVTPRATWLLGDLADNADVARVPGRDAQADTVPRSIKLPAWVGYFLLSVGSTLVLRSWTMRRPN